MEALYLNCSQKCWLILIHAMYSTNMMASPPPLLLLDGHESHFKLEFLEYVNEVNSEGHKWTACIGVPYRMIYWQVGDSVEQNGSFKIIDSHGMLLGALPVQVHALNTHKGIVGDLIEKLVEFKNHETSHDTDANLHAKEKIKTAK